MCLLHVSESGSPIFTHQQIRFPLQIWLQLQLSYTRPPTPPCSLFLLSLTSPLQVWLQLRLPLRAAQRRQHLQHRRDGGSHRPQHDAGGRHGGPHRTLHLQRQIRWGGARVTPSMAGLTALFISSVRSGGGRVESTTEGAGAEGATGEEGCAFRWEGGGGVPSDRVGGAKILHVPN